MKALITASGLRAGSLLTKRASLPEPVQRRHRRTLLTVGQSGKPPTHDQLLTWVKDFQINDLDASLQQLAEAELVFPDPAGRKITGGVPFAPPLLRTGSGSSTARLCSRTVPWTPWASRQCSAATSTSSPSMR